MAASLCMARVALLFVAIMIAMNPGAHGFMTVAGAAANGFATSEELKALTALVELQTTQISRLEDVVANISTMIIDFTSSPAEAPISTTSLGNGLVPGAARRKLDDEDDDDEDEPMGILTLPPRLIASMQDLQIIIPMDWECQTGTNGGVYPCPTGIPSTCSLKRKSFYLGEGAGLSESCAACFCLKNSHTCCQYVGATTAILTSKCNAEDACGGGDLADWKQEPVARSDGSTVRFGCADWTNHPDWCDSLPGKIDSDTDIAVEDACAVCRSPDELCYFDKTYDLPGWATSSGGHGCDTFTTNPHWCDNPNVDDTTGITVGLACAACRKRVFGSCSSKLTEKVWGDQWWDEDGAVSYVNFKITRYEMSPTFGIEFYSTEGDTVRVLPSGQVHFKPNDAKRSLVVNEQIVYDMPEDSARARVLSTGLLEEPHASPDPNLPLSTLQLQQMREDLIDAQGPELQHRRSTRASRSNNDQSCGRGGCTSVSQASFLNVGLGV